MSLIALLVVLYMPSGWHVSRAACLGASGEAVVLPQLEQLVDVVAQAVPCHPVVPEDAGRARVREQIGVALMQMPPREGPVVQRGSCTHRRALHATKREETRQALCETAPRHPMSAQVPLPWHESDKKAAGCLINSMSRHEGHRGNDRDGAASYRRHCESGEAADCSSSMQRAAVSRPGTCVMVF